jgi:NAD(P)-dependent dehydrogenase (short-subunit alcohol dehydrogenase family)
MAEAVSARGADVTVIARSKARLAEAARMELKTSSAPEACLHQRCDAPSSPTHLGSDPRYRSGVAWGLTVGDAPVGLDT